MVRILVPLLLASLGVAFATKSPVRQAGDVKYKLTLPWGTWEGKPYKDEEETTILFKNVRFAQAPTGPLRFAAPKYPDAIENPKDVQNDEYGPKCIQAKIGQNITYEPIGDGSQSEDCLFLDLYVPSWALEEGDPTELPVIVWIYGGAYIFGAKDAEFNLTTGPMNAYDGHGIRDIADHSVIWVTGNYRLGAFGFLAGNTMEEKGQPNAGLHDQRLLLDWVQKYIGQVGGDKEAVSVWGLSAGAGSILHHLTAYGGKAKQQLFSKAALWSTAFQWGYDRTGALENTFKVLSQKLNCPNAKDLDCLRDVSMDDLGKANQEIVTEEVAKGMFPFGPAVDGDLVPDLPANLLRQGMRVDCSSMIVSNDYDETSLFLPKWVKNESDFDAFAALAFPGDDFSSVRQRILEQYPSESYDFQQQTRLRRVLRDSTFVCNTRQLYNAYKGSSKVYTSRYDIPPAQHGFDLFPLVWHSGIDIADLLEPFPLPEWVGPMLHKVWSYLAQTYQSYFVSHAVYGDPNAISRTQTQWLPTEDDGTEFTNTMKIGLYNVGMFSTGRDQHSSTENCAFWDEMAEEISKITNKGSSKHVSFKDQSEGAFLEL